MQRKTKLLGLVFAGAIYAAALLIGLTFTGATSGCASIKDTPIVGDIVPDLTDPEELRDAAELAGALVLQNNPKHVAAIHEAVELAQKALAGEGVITREMFDRWLLGLLDKTIEDPTLRIFVRQRFERAWEKNHQLLDVSGLILTNPKHRELAEAFVAGLTKAANAFAEA